MSGTKVSEAILSKHSQLGVLGAFLFLAVWCLSAKEHRHEKDRQPSSKGLESYAEAFSRRIHNPLTCRELPPIIREPRWYLPMIGETLGHYGVIEKIGSGGMGEVYRAHDEQLDRDVALKVLPIGALADEARRKLFRKEALVLAKLNHPNIATV